MSARLRTHSKHAPQLLDPMNSQVQLVGNLPRGWFTSFSPPQEKQATNQDDP